MQIQSELLRLAAVAGWLTPQANIEAIMQNSMASNRDLNYLFGGKEPWNTSTLVWKAVDDRVRGGSSQSYLDPVEGTSSARFRGVLDTKTLGGAGFASQSTKAVSSESEKDVEEPIWSLGLYDGLLLGITSGDDKTYTVTMKDELPESKREDGRERSGVSWEADFTISPNPASQSEADSGRIINAERTEASKEVNFLVRIPWHKFRATYRGRDKPDTKPLDLDNIRRFALMARSFFEKQDDEFELVINYIATYATHESLRTSPL